MEEEQITGSSMQHCSSRNRIVSSHEIVEVMDDSMSIGNEIDGTVRDVYVAVGRDDLDVLKWALDHVVSPGARVFLVHVCPPITYISTPVGRLSKSQVSQDQLRIYTNGENNRIRSKLQKYIRLCTNAKVTVDTIILKNSSTAKAILELILVLNITYLVMGIKRPPYPRFSSLWGTLTKKPTKGEYVKKNAPDFCEVSIVHGGKKFIQNQQGTERVHLSSSIQLSRTNSMANSVKTNFWCSCFSPKVR